MKFFYLNEGLLNHFADLQVVADAGDAGEIGQVGEGLVDAQLLKSLRERVCRLDLELGQLHLVGK